MVVVRRVGDCSHHGDDRAYGNVMECDAASAVAAYCGGNQLAGVSADHLELDFRAGCNGAC